MGAPSTQEIELAGSGLDSLWYNESTMGRTRVVVSITHTDSPARGAGCNPGRAVGGLLALR